MTTTQPNVSEVTAILALIEAEHLAASRALYELTAGSARHSFITAKQQRIGEHFETLTTLMPRDQATGLVVEALMHAESHQGGNPTHS